MYGAAGKASTPLLLPHIHTELEVLGVVSVQGRWDHADEGNYKRVNLLCIAANGSCLQ